MGPATHSTDAEPLSGLLDRVLKKFGPEQNGAAGPQWSLTSDILPPHAGETADITSASPIPHISATSKGVDSPSPTPQPAQDTGSSTLPDYIPAEVSLETLGYFIPSSKRIKNIDIKEETIAVISNPDGTTTELKVSFIYTRKYGIPNTSDLDYYRAFLKILDESLDEDGQIPDPLRLPTKRLMRYAGKQTRGGKLTKNQTSQEVKDWIRINHYTGMQGFLYNAETGEYAEIGEEPLFRKYLLRGQKMNDGELADTNHVWLALWFRRNYQRGYLRPIDHTFYKRLRKPIAKSLYPLLETGWYASDGKPYTKSYPSLCKKFLLAEHRHLSYIKQQLDPSHKELQREHFLSQWEYRKSANGEHYVIIYYAGKKFFQDQQAREVRRKLAKHTIHRAEILPEQQEEKTRQELLVQDILAVTRDSHSTAFYRLVAQKMSDATVRRALSETKVAFHMGDIRTTRPQYFTNTIKRFAKEQGVTL